MRNQTINLNLIPQGIMPVVHLSQYDQEADGSLIFNIYNGVIPCDLTGCVAHIQGAKPDETLFDYECTVHDTYITCATEYQMTVVAGNYEAELRISKNDESVGTINFMFAIEDAASSGGDISKSDLPGIMDIINTAKTQAVNAAQVSLDSSEGASESAQAAAESEANAKNYAEAVAGEATNAEAWARGTRNGEPIPDTDEAYENNSKWYAEHIGDEVEDAEAWAKGTRNGEPVPNTDETYHNNAKYYSEAVQGENEDAEAWAKGTRGGVPVDSDDPTYHNNSKYWSEQSGTSRLVSMEDINITNPADGDFLKYDETEKKWVNDKVDLEKLSDVDITNVQNGEALVYDIELGKWVNKIATQHIVSVPSVTGLSFTYDGTEKGPTITGLPSDWNKYVIMTGNKGINAGSYELRFSLKNTSIYVWGDGTTQDIVYSWEIAKITLTIPSVSASLTYNGSPQSPIITDFDSNTMTKRGDVETNAGSHNVTFSIIDPDNYEWSDHTTEDKLKPWSIAKAAGSITLSASSISLDSDHTSRTVMANGATGTITVSSSDSTVATGSVSGNTITISSPSNKSGNATITVNVAASTNYLATSKTIAVEASFLVFVTWANGTDKQLATMLEAHYAGEINIYDYWSVGDERTVSLSAMTKGAVGETHVAQNVTMVLMNAGGKTLANGKTCAFVVGQKNFLANGTSGEDGYMNNSASNNGGWKSSARRTWCNETYYNAIASGFKALLKQFINKSGTGRGSSSGTEDTTDWTALPAEVEVFGITTYSVSGEGSQFKYYETSANRIKKAGDSGSANRWWERSPYSGNSSGFCLVYSNGRANGSDASNARGLAPFGCI